MKIENVTARRLQGSSGSAPLGDLSTLTDGHALTVQADGTIAPEASAAAGVGGSTGAVDNAILRANGTGGATAQSSALVIDDSGNLTGAGTIDVGNADTTLSRAAAGVVAVEGVNLIRGATGATDNALLRADGTGGSLAQAGGGATLSDAGVIENATWQGTAITRAYGGYQPVSSASAPTVNDDSDDGYAVGQVWIETTSDLVYILADASVGAAVWRSLLRASAVEIRLVAGVWTAFEQAWTGSAWVDVTAGTALTVETAGPCTLSGTSLTITSGMTAAASPHNAPSKWYLTLTSLSFWNTASYGIYAIDSTETTAGIDDQHARWGFALATPTGDFDSNTENRFSARRGWDTSFAPDNWVIRTATTTNTYNVLLYANPAKDTLARYVWVQGASLGWSLINAASPVSTGVTPGTTIATRLYVLGMASGTMTADTAFDDPRVRLIKLAGSP